MFAARYWRHSPRAPASVECGGASSAAVYTVRAASKPREHRMITSTSTVASRRGNLAEREPDRCKSSGRSLEGRGCRPRRSRCNLPCVGSAARTSWQVGALRTRGRDTEPTSGALFPEFLRSELHGTRTTFEAYSRAGRSPEVEKRQRAGCASPSAAKGVVRVTTKFGSRFVYRIDRWD